MAQPPAVTGHCTRLAFVLSSALLVAAGWDAIGVEPVAADEQAPAPRLVPADPPPQPSAGSGRGGQPAGQPKWIELDDFVPGLQAAPLESSGASLPEVPQPKSPSAAPRVSFNGVINSPVTGTPPDTHLAVGPGLGGDGRVVMVTNGHLQIWDKTGTTIAGPTLLDTVFGANCFDPKVLYDQHSGRFFMVSLEGAGPSFSRIHIAVSSGGRPGNLTSDWTFMSGSAATTVGSVPTWADYPGIGADDDSLFVTANLFDSDDVFRGIKIRVFDKAALMAGIYSFVDLNYDTTTYGVGTTQPAHVYGTTDNGGFYLINRIGSTSYRIFNITGDPAAPLATTSTHSWSGGNYPSPNLGADQLGTSVRLATLASRVMNAVYRDGHIWLCLTADPDGDGQTEVVWQDIATGGSAAAASVFQSGFLNGTGSEPWTYMPSINVNSSGHVAICYTQSSLTRYPDVVYVTRRSSDPPGTFRAPVVAKAGPGYYDSFASLDPDRWGDYSACVVDPADDSFWVANEFAWSSAPADSEWAAFIAGFSEPGNPQISLATEDGLDWVYQNTPLSLANGGHKVRLEITVENFAGNGSVAVSVAKAGGSGPGEVTIENDPQGDPLVKYIVGSLRSDGVAETGLLAIEVTATGDLAGQTTELLPFTVRRLGDVDGINGVEPTDVAALILKLNNNPPPYHPNAFDLDHNGGPEPNDVAILINILNGFSVP
ncbi:MAG: hypothetical protein GWP05_07020 [Anaerolineaceae bacterium]|nr:hypothetical protein [Anaerolineaceae bacterium]